MRFIALCKQVELLCYLRFCYSLNLERIAGSDVITYISAMIELRRFDYKL